MKNIYILLFSILLINGCGSFKAERVDSAESDEKALEITDEWVNGDTERIVVSVIKKIQDHRGFRRYLGRYSGSPKIFIGEVQNLTSEAFFPINDINDELLNEISATGDFVLIDNEARGSILKEITYQNDGMVDPKTAKMIGKQTGADLMVFGNVFMRPKKRDGKTIKEYRVNLRLTDIEKAVEVARVRAKIFKYSKQSSVGW